MSPEEAHRVAVGAASTGAADVLQAIADARLRLTEVQGVGWHAVGTNPGSEAGRNAISALVTAERLLNLAYRQMEISLQEFVRYGGGF